jgi:thymidine kinase
MTIKKGTLEVIYGPMYSGKTMYLINTCRTAKNFVVFKPDLDNRYTTRPVLRTHSGVEASAIKIDVHKAQEIDRVVKELIQIQKVKLVIIDEVNLFDKQLIGVVNRLLEKGINVLAAGILLDTEKGDFGQTGPLMALADESLALYAHCDYPHCKQPAAFTYAKKVKQTQVMVGATDLYGAACSDHYDILHVPGKSENVIPIRRDTIRELVSLGVYPAYAEWLRRIKFPTRELQNGGKQNNWLRIEIGGDGVKVGKSDVLRNLETWFKRKQIPVMTFDNEATINPFFSDNVIKDNERVFLAEKWFIKQKFDLLLHLKKNYVSLVSIPPEMDFCFAVTSVLLGRMSIQQFFEYEKYYHHFDWPQIYLPDLMIYVSNSEKLIKKQQMGDRNAYEDDDNYAPVLRIVNRAWLNNLSDRIKVIDWPANELKPELPRQLSVTLETELAKKGYN